MEKKKNLSVLIFSLKKNMDLTNNLHTRGMNQNYLLKISLEKREKIIFRILNPKPWKKRKDNI